LAVSLLAEVDGAVVGHVAVSPVTVASGPVGGGVGPVAVVREKQ
jgi:putative acetyltransferase